VRSYDIELGKKVGYPAGTAGARFPVDAILNRSGACGPWWAALGWPTGSRDILDKTSNGARQEQPVRKRQVPTQRPWTRSGSDLDPRQNQIRGPSWAWLADEHPSLDRLAARQGAAVAQDGTRPVVRDDRQPVVPSHGVWG
jgi:hypothetical protein